MNSLSAVKAAADPTSERQPRLDGKILIIGGYGQVGQMIAVRLAALFPGRVVVAGRSLAKARAAAAGIGHGVEARALDIFAVDNAAALDGVALVLVCLDQTDRRFAAQCLARGLRYLDISADYGFLSQVEELDACARQTGATALLSVGVAPGLTNLLAARACATMAGVARLDILLEIGLGDHHGQAAIEWLFDNLDVVYQVREAGRLKSVRSFGDSLDLALPGAKTARPAYRFNFSDQQVIGRTLDVPTVSTWIRFEDRLPTWIFAKAAQGGLGRLLRRRWWRKLAVWLFMNVHMGSDRCGVAVRATASAAAGGKELLLGVVGRKEALMTAIVAAETARQALLGDLPAGVVHSEQVIDLEAVIQALDKELPDLAVTL